MLGDKMLQDDTSNNKRIAKNTFFLYVRTFVILLVTLYTSRIVLEALGVEDYGIYNVVGGFVAMFALLSGALSNAISRYITIELGRGDIKSLKSVFSTSIEVQTILAIVIVVIAELVGVWFLNVKMNVPAERMQAANWVFQCSLLTFAINLISIPYNACIIAHEQMGTFAYISVLEVLLKLGSVLFLFVFGFDRLIVYAVLLACIAILIRLIYGFYCKHHFEECSYHYTFDKKLIREMTALASWNILGSGGAILNSHGVNLLMNLFFGVTVNAARGIAEQVNNAVTQFVNSFTTAVNPQITKSYAKEEKDYTFKLVLMSSKYSYFLMLILAVPIIAETPLILQLWLKIVPDYTVLFVRLTLIASLIATLSIPLYTLALATGDIKKYQIIIGSLSLFCFFVTYVCYKLGASVESAYFVFILTQIAILFARSKILSDLTGLNMSVFFSEVVVKALVVSLIIFIVTYIALVVLPEQTFANAMIIIPISALASIVIILFLGLKKSERNHLLSMIKKK